MRKRTSSQQQQGSMSTGDHLAVNTIRALAADVVQKANSGHPGAPMGLAPLAHVLWSRVMQYNPANPKWINRDRFVLSNGHGCALQYIMLHLAGYDLSMDDLQQFRQVNSKTPGHPENHATPGIEVTTGPLGQGVCNAVGLAIAQRRMAAMFNKPDLTILDSYVYCIVGDGCLMEGVSSEACSLAGHLGLGNLIVFYDSNAISIDGSTQLAFTEDVMQRYQSYGWHVLDVPDGDSNLQAMEDAIRQAQGVKDRPSFIRVTTTIGYGSANAGTEKVHGAPLGQEDIANVKRSFGFDPNKHFHVPDEVKSQYAALKQKGAEIENKWNGMLGQYTQRYPDNAHEMRRILEERRLPDGWENCLPRWKTTDAADATRKTSQAVLNALAAVTPELMGGSADLTPSNNTAIKGATDFQSGNPEGRYLRFGVREHAMYAIANGIALFGGPLPFVATFTNFIEYGFPAVRLSALSNAQVLCITTHDSIGLGEDGPTHQPVEVMALLRATPNLLTLRPADGNETSGAYLAAMKRQSGPSVLLLSRQTMPQLAQSQPEKVLQGAYVVHETDGKSGQPDLCFIASGSEVSLCINALKEAPLQGKSVRVVSMPCSELFDEQQQQYRQQVLPPGVPVIAVEALTACGLERYSHCQIAMRSFGMSGPGAQVMDHFGFTPAKVAQRADQLVQKLSQALASHNMSVPLLPVHYDE